MKTCSRCKETKPLGQFYADRSRPDGKQYHCSDCQKVYTGAPLAQARRRARYKFDFRKHLESTYGITKEKWDAMLLAQEGRCAACSSQFENDGRRIHTDHCHETGEVRGLLCKTCNRAEGLLKTALAARGLYEYMARWQR